MNALKIIFLLLILGAKHANAGSSVENRKPNVILIMADDVSWECFGSYGAEDYQTQNSSRCPFNFITSTNFFNSHNSYETNI
jgi:arylsulfatase A